MRLEGLSSVMMIILQPITSWLAAWLYWRVFRKVGLLGNIRLVALLPALVWLASILAQLVYSQVAEPVELVQVTTLNGEVILAPDPSGTPASIHIWSSLALLVASWIPLAVLAFAKFPLASTPQTQTNFE